MSANRRFAVLGSAALAVGVLGLASTGGTAAGKATHSKAAKTVTVAATNAGHHRFKFNSVTAKTGDDLRILDKTHAPHTLSFYVGRKLPHTRKEYKHCFSSGPCGDVAAWHKFRNGHIHRNPVHAGGRGWDTMGSSAKKKGDSVVFLPHKLPKTRPITAPAGTKIYFFCAIHPDMQGTITVK
jgi:plastocyanin